MWKQGQRVAPDTRFLAQKGIYECYLAENRRQARVLVGVTRDRKKIVLYSPHRRRYSHPPSLLMISLRSEKKYHELNAL